MFIFLIFSIIAINPRLFNTVQSSNVCQKLEECQSATIPIVDQHQSTFSGTSPKWPLTYSCRNLRDHLDCLLTLSPYCERRDILTPQTTWNLVYKSKMYLEQKCDREIGVMNSPCYRSPGVKKCESLNPSPGPVNSLNCWKYVKFRDCVHSAIRTDCSPQEQNLVNQYLIDRSKNMSWLCINSTQPTTLVKVTSPPLLVDRNDPNNLEPDRKGLTDSLAKKNSAVSLYTDQDTSSQYVGYPAVAGYPPSSVGLDHYPGSRLYRDEGYPGPDRIPIGGRYPDRHYPGPPPLTSGYPGYPGGQVYDPLRPGYPDSVPGGYSNANLDICLERSRYLSKHCEDALLQSQRIAHHYRTPSEVQRAICCGLFYYRDCMYRVLQHTCPGTDPFTLSMALPIAVNQQLATCRGYSRIDCSGTISANRASLLPILVSFIVIFYNKYYSYSYPARKKDHRNSRGKKISSISSIAM